MIKKVFYLWEMQKKKTSKNNQWNHFPFPSYDSCKLITRKGKYAGNYLSTVLTSSLLCIQAGRRSSVNCLGKENDMQHTHTQVENWYIRSTF